MKNTRRHPTPAATTIYYNDATWVMIIDPSRKGMGTFSATLTVDQYVASRARLNAAKGRQGMVTVLTSQDNANVPKDMLAVSMYAAVEALD